MKIESNIKKYYVFNFLRNLNFWLPVFTIFFLDRGLDFKQIMMLYVVTSISQIIFELPTGVFADHFGRKKALLMGNFAAILMVVFFYYGTSSQFIFFILAEICFAFWVSSNSGSDSAFIYDTLIDLKREKEYKRIEGNALFFRWSAMGVGAFFGGFIAKVSIPATLLFWLVAFIINIFVIMSFKEPKKHKDVTKGDYMLHLKEAMVFVFKHKKIRLIIVYFGFMMMAMLITFQFLQPYMQSVGISLSYFGVIYAIFLFISALASKFAYKIEFKISQKNSLILIPLFLFILMMVLGNYIFIYGVIFFILAEFTWGFMFPIVHDYINRQVKSSRRATVLSIKGFFTNIIILFLAPIFGYVADLYTIKEVFLLNGIVILISSVPILYFLLKKGKCERTRVNASERSEFARSQLQ